jgi:hypothetical protein
VTGRGRSLRHACATCHKGFIADLSNAPRPTAVPIAPVDQRLAAVAVPGTESLSTTIAPPPIKPIPVIQTRSRRAPTRLTGKRAWTSNNQATAL